MQNRNGKYTLLLISCILLLLSFSTTLECNTKTEAAEVEMTIFYSADLSGYIEPCG